MGPLENVHLDVQVQLAHALEDGFAAFLVGFDMEGGVFLNHLAQGDAQLFSLALSFGATAMEITGSGKTIGSRVAGWSGSHRV